MRRFLFTISGVAIGYGIGYLLVSVFAHWYKPRFIKSDDELGVAYFYSLIFLAVISVAGGFAGWRWKKIQIMKSLDMPAQRLVIMALKSQIQTWRATCEQLGINEDDVADMQNDIGCAFSVLSELEENFFQQFGQHVG